MRMPSGKELLILQLLRTHGAMYGLQIVRRSKGEIGRTGVYMMLVRLCEKSLVEHASVRPCRPGPYYRVTALGRRAIMADKVLRG